MLTRLIYINKKSAQVKFELKPPFCIFTFEKKKQNKTKQKKKKNKTKQNKTKPKKKTPKPKKKKQKKKKNPKKKKKKTKKKKKKNLSNLRITSPNLPGIYDAIMPHLRISAMGSEYNSLFVSKVCFL